MAVPPREILDYVVAELRVGARAPDDVLTRLRDAWLWDESSASRLQADIVEAHEEGRLTDAEAGSLSRGLAAWLVSMADEDPTETIGEHTPAVVEMRLTRESQVTSSLELLPGAILGGRYVLGEALARGGQSIIFRAHVLRNDERALAGTAIAIKVLKDATPSQAAIARLRREFRQTQSLKHPGVPEMFDLDCDRGTWFIAMELLEGVSLRTRLKRLATQPLGVPEALQIVAECAAVLGQAHGRGFVHGDIKPGNVFLQKGGAVKVLDFGSACDIQPAPRGVALESGSFSAAATRTYASPEVLDGLAVEPRDDIFSLACVGYEMLAGRHPFGRVAANEARVHAMQVSPVAGLSPFQNAALLGALAWSRTERPSSIEKWVDGLLDTTPRVVAEGRTHADRAATPMAQWLPWRWIGAVCVAAALLFIATWLASRSGDGRDAASALVGDPPSQVDQLQEGLSAAPTAPSVQEGSSRKLESTVVVPPPAPSQSLVEAPKTTPVQAVAPSASAATTSRRARIAVENQTIRISEGAPAAVVVLRRGGSTAAPVTVTWELQAGSALNGEDFVNPAGRSTRFARGQTTRAIYVPLVNDDRPESEEFFTLILSAPAAAIDGSNRAEITILDDD